MIPNARKSSRGRYFGEHGTGIGGTTIETPRDAIKSVDMTCAHAGMQILVLNTTGEIRALFEVQADGDVKEIPMTDKATALADDIMKNCEQSLTSVMYTGGTGGSARGGVCSKPVSYTHLDVYKRQARARPSAPGSWPSDTRGGAPRWGAGS